MRLKSNKFNYSIFLFLLFFISGNFYSQEKLFRGYYDVKTYQRGFDLTINYTIKLTRAGLNNDVYIQMNFLPERKNSTQAYYIDGKVHALDNMGAFSKRITLSNIKTASATVLVEVNGQSKKIVLNYIPLKNRFSSPIFVLDKFNFDEETKRKLRNNLNNFRASVLKMNVDNTDSSIEKAIKEYNEKIEADKELDKIKYMSEDSVDDIYEKLKAYNRLSKYGDFAKEKGELRQKLADFEKIKDLKSKIGKLGNSKEELEKKLNYYKELAKIDNSSYYTNEIRSLKYDLADIDREKKKKEYKKTVEKKYNSTKKPVKNTQNNNTTTSKTKKELEEEADYYEGRRRTKKIIEERKAKETERAINNFRNSAGKVFSSVFTSAFNGGNKLKFVYGMRSFVGDKKNARSALDGETIEIGYGIGKIGFSVGYNLVGGFGEWERDDTIASGSVWAFGLDYTIIKFDFLGNAEFGVNIEYGFGSGELQFRRADGSIGINESNSKFYSGGVQLRFLNFVYVSYNYGSSKNDSGPNSTPFNANYTKLGIGLKYDFSE